MRTLRLAAGVAVSFLLAATQALAESPDAAPAPIADAELAQMSGGQATLPSAISMVLTNQTENASNSNNVVSAGGNVSSGNVNLGQNAFQGFAGIGNFVINTGHENNLIGNLSVAINMAPSGTAP
jgi:predicted ribonuclease toxin of YeeF-YezG toxin-antitoxin module